MRMNFLQTLFNFLRLSTGAFQITKKYHRLLILRNHKWLTPAEPVIPLTYVLRAYINGNITPNSFEGSFGAHSYRFGCSARSLLFKLLSELKQKNGNSRNEVLIPAYTCYSVAAAIVKAGLTIKIYDLDPRTFNPDLNSISRYLSERTIAVVSQHLFGIPADIEGINEIAHAEGGVHIEDAAQAMGGRGYWGYLGAKGDYGLFSFGRGKPLPLGSGGMLIAQKNANEIKNMRNFGPFGLGEIANMIAISIFSKPVLYRFIETLPIGLGQTKFDPKFEIGEMSTATKHLYYVCAPLLDSYNLHRRKIAEIYRERLSPNGLIAEPQGSSCVYTRFPYLAPSWKVAQRLRQYGIRQMYPKSLNRESEIVPYISNPEEEAPGAMEIARRLITLPTHSLVSATTAAQVCKALKDEIG